MSVFGKNNGRSNRVKRNTFDLSMQNNLTTKFGQLTPVLCKEVLPGDSFRINTTFGLRFAPTYFPLQSRIRADIHYFYVRNRNLWSDWMDFIGNTKTGLVPPYRNSTVQTGSLGDYLGIPTVKFAFSKPVLTSESFTSLGSLRALDPLPDACSSLSFTDIELYSIDRGGGNTGLTASSNRYVLPAVPIRIGDPGSLDSALFFVGKKIFFSIPFKVVPANLVSENQCPALTPFFLTFRVSWDTGTSAGVVQYFSEPLPLSRPFGYSGQYFESPVLTRKYFDDYAATFGATSDNISVTLHVCFQVDPKANPYYFALDSSLSPFVYGYQVLSPSVSAVGAGDFSGINLSALPFRAYESIYNSFYRDDRNNPRLVNGEPVYNEYLRSKDGGLDQLEYPLYFRNWEQDFLTTAVPTPQQGNAPLVGISSTGEMTFSYDGKEYTAQAQTADDADTIVSAQFKESVPNAVSRSLVDVVSSGISINDFRNVNAFQRWKETNLRRGMKYKDQIKSHFDVNVSYAELDMPEFIGGVSIPVVPNTVSATAESGEVQIGDYRGQLYGSGSSKHSVSHYFDEHGFVIGILSVVPVPVYSQLLPKFFLKNNPLDYFFPEFGHIGFQPISNNEVNMLAVENKQDPGTFGYQRPWYDYLASVDEIHGDFRKEGYDDFVLSRTFSGVPTLGSDFTVIRPDSLNHVFMYTGDNDKILGQIYFDISAKRPIPLYGVPRLEADL